jgi:predicted permease
MPKSFDFPLGGNDAWTLLTFTPPQLQSHGFRSLLVLARLKDGVSPAQADAELAVISQTIAKTEPAASAGWVGVSESLYENLVANVRPSLLILQGAVLFVLLIACVNVAALLSARMAVRQHEVGLQTALGASRGGLIRQLLTESVLLSVAGGVAGFLLAMWGLKGLVAAIPAGSLPRTAEIGLDWRVFGFTLLLAVGTGVLFGLAPAVQSTRTVLTSVLGDSGRRTSASRGQRAFRSGLVVLEVVLSLVLLIGAALLMRTFVTLSQIDPGFKSDGVLVNSQLVLPVSKYGQDFRGNQFFTDLLARLERIPGIESAGGITALPLQGNSRTVTYAVAGEPARAPGDERRTVFNVVAGDYFKTMSIPLKGGRLFTERDDRNAPRVALVNEALATQVFGRTNPIGQHLTLGSPAVTYEIVGVVGSTRQFGLTTPPQPEVFASYLADPITYMYVLTKSAGDPSRFIPAIRQEVRAVDPDQPVGHRTLAQQFENSIANSRFYTMLLGVFGVTALVLAAVGIYGVMSYVVAQRTREFGIRLALGAEASHVRLLVVRQGVLLVLLGLVIGLGLAWALTRYLASLLYDITPTDLTTFAVVAAVLGAVALVAGYLPARRATRVSPIAALRAE